MRQTIVTEPSQRLEEGLVGQGIELMIASDISEVLNLLDSESSTALIVEMSASRIGRQMTRLVDIVITKPETTVFVVSDEFSHTPVGLCLLSSAQRGFLMPDSQQDELPVGAGWIYLGGTQQVLLCNTDGLLKAFKKEG